MNDRIKKTPVIMPNMTLILVAVALLITMVAFLALNQSAAWLAESGEVSANGQTVTIKDGSEMHAQLVTYAVTEITGNIYNLADEQSYTLPTHDPNNISYSKYKKALVVLIEVSSYEAKTVKVTLQNETPSISEEAQNVISNCIKITNASFDSQNRVATASGNAQSFVTFSSEGAPSKVTSLNLTTVSLSPNTPVTLCYVIEYNQDFLNYLQSSTLDFDEMDFSDDIDFVIDIT